MIHTQMIQVPDQLILRVCDPSAARAPTRNQEGDRKTQGCSRTLEWDELEEEWDPLFIVSGCLGLTFETDKI